MTGSEAIAASRSGDAATFPSANPMKSIMSADLNEQWPPRVEICTSLQYRVLESKWMVVGWYMDDYGSLRRFGCP